MNFHNSLSLVLIKDQISHTKFFITNIVKEIVVVDSYSGKVMFGNDLLNKYYRVSSANTLRCSHCKVFLFLLKVLLNKILIYVRVNFNQYYNDIIIHTFCLPFFNEMEIRSTLGWARQAALLRSPPAPRCRCPGST